jgi:dimethylargininase
VDAGAVARPGAMPIGALRLAERPARLAFTREVSPTLAACELTHLRREPIDVARARAQHAAYEDALTRLGCEVVRLPPLPELPDAVFVEDTAVVLNEVAVITRPGAPSRRAETASTATALGSLRPLVHLRDPETLDGGDVLRVGRTLWVGRSGRTNAEGVAALGWVLLKWGYTIRPVDVRGCLHLKSAATAVDDGLVLINPDWVDRHAFAGFEVVEVDSGEPCAANALRLGEALLYPTAFPRTRARLEARGLHIVAVDLSELAKAEGAVTCCSLIVESIGDGAALPGTAMEE